MTINQQQIISYFNEYGLILVFIIMYLEGLNLTGIPALVLLPTIGMFSASSSLSLMLIVTLTVLGSLLGNITCYMIVRCLGNKVYRWLYNKFKSMRKSLNKAQMLSNKYGNGICMIGRLIPGVRTIISLLAGTFKVRFDVFLIFSTLGIFIWNFILIYVGYIIS